MTPMDEARPLSIDIMREYNSATGELSTSRRTSVTSAENDEDELHQTTCTETFLHLLKGYLGPGCLSLPWAVGQLGIPGGFIAIFAMSYWTSYNCWTVVKIKRYIEQTQADDNPEQNDGEEEGTATSISTNITYPDVGHWADGTKFQAYIRACICVTQLAVCTVFLSFVGENLLAVLTRLEVNNIGHGFVITMVLPAVMMLSCLPNLKALAPVVAVATLLLFLGFGCLGVVVGEKWNDRPEETPTINPSSAPLAICAILYSYEGICLILPVESAMKEPQHFQKVFVSAMTFVAFVLAAVSCTCVWVFGKVTNGSVTAFLVETYRDDPSIAGWLMVANTAVSLSVLLTYPLQLFPALELIGPWLSRKLLHYFNRPDGTTDEDNDLSAFEPLPPLEEHRPVSPSEMTPSEHHYGQLNGDAESDEIDSSANSRTSSLNVFSIATQLPKMTMPGDSPLLRALLVMLTYLVAVIVPNVQALISLAGALAGSSTALLIPPLLELAWIKRLDYGNDDLVESQWICIPAPNSWKLHWPQLIKCYLLFLAGLVFLVIGTYASIADIIRVYIGN